jgi:hypothetical protein
MGCAVKDENDLPYIENMDRSNIWMIEQNKPSLVADDLVIYDVPRNVVHTILLARGVYKWLSVRRKLIKLKDGWKTRVSIESEEIKKAKKDGGGYEFWYHKGYLKALEDCRRDVRELCHSDRWQAPDFDEESRRFLEEHGKQK